MHPDINEAIHTIAYGLVATLQAQLSLNDKALDGCHF